VLWAPTQFQQTRPDFNHILGCNPVRVATLWVGNGLNVKGQKFAKYGSFVNQNSTGMKKFGCNLLGGNPFLILLG
jgi:hypothetical protein